MEDCMRLAQPGLIIMAQYEEELICPFDDLIIIREAIVQKIPFFYEILSQTGGRGQPDFISLIQKC